MMGAVCLHSNLRGTGANWIEIIIRGLKEEARGFTLLLRPGNEERASLNSCMGNLTYIDRIGNIERNQDFWISETEEGMPEYLQVRSNGQITLPAATRRKAKLQEGDLLEVVFEEDGSIRLVPKTPVDRKLAEQYQLKDVNWARKQKKGSKK